MAEFKYNLDDVSSTSAIAKKTAENFYNGQSKPLKTTYSENGDQQRTLTQRDLQSVLSGDALYRSPAFALQVSNQNVQSSINQILASGAATDAKDLVIQDPNSDNPNKTLTGSDAFNAIVAKSSLGKGGLSFGVQNYASQLTDSNFSSGEEQHQDATERTFDATKGGKSEFRVVTIKENLTPEEQRVFDQKIKDLESTAILTDKVTHAKAANFAKISKDDVVKLTDSRGIGDPNGNLYLSSSEDFASYNGKTVVPCASIIECLLYLNTKIKIRGRFDFARGWIRAGGGSDLNGGTLNDHVCGRAIDIFEIGKDEGSMINLKSKNINDYKKAMDILLPVLDAMDEALHPDLLAVHDGLSDEYGIVGGAYEIDTPEGKTKNGILQKQYTSLRRVDFHPDSGHRDHIHLAFGPERAGTYKDWTDFVVDTGSTDTTVTIDKKLVTGDPNDESELFGSFYSKPSSQIKNTNALYRALINYGNFSAEVAAIFMCIVERESNFHPASVNFGPEISGDYSPGLFQYNFYGNPSLIEREFIVAIDNSIDKGNKLDKKRVKGFKLLFKDWEKFGIKDKNTTIAKMLEVGAKPSQSNGERMRTMEQGRALADPRLFIPITQIMILANSISHYKTRWKFTNWGEYENGPEYGWITKLKFETAVQFYVENNPGKTRNDLVDFCKPMIRNMIITKGKINFNAWLAGETFGF